MDKRRLNHYLSRLKKMPFWWLAVASLLFFVTAIFALRANNQKMIELRAAVFAADEQGGDVETALKNLREHVYQHMNTDLAAGNNIRPPIQLKYRYERLLAAEKARIESINSTIYTDAQNYCEQQISQGFSGRGRIPCIEEYVDSHGVAANPIPEDVYKFDFLSPRWSPDLAGWSLVLGFASLGLFVLGYLSEYVISSRLKRHN